MTEEKPIEAWIGQGYDETNDVVRVGVREAQRVAMEELQLRSVVGVRDG